jgi:hypothetical protein
MFDNGQRSTARHRATAEDTSAFNGSPHAQPEKVPAAAGRTPIWATALAFTALVLLLLGIWALFGRGPSSAPSGSGPPSASPSKASPTTTPTAPAVARPGLSTVVRLRPDGTLRATERVTFGRPRSTLAVSVPARPGAGAQFGPSVTDLRVRAHGKVHRGEGFLSSGEATNVRLASPARRVVIRYSVRNTVARSTPSVPDRGLALVTPVAVARLAGVPSNVKVVSPHVLSIGCVSPRGVLATCGSRTAHGWQVRAAAGQPAPDVVAQVRLPS